MLALYDEQPTAARGALSVDSVRAAATAGRAIALDRAVGEALMRIPLQFFVSSQPRAASPVASRR
jgi:hypothetical protein